MNDKVMIIDWTDGKPDKDGSYLVKEHDNLIVRDTYIAERGGWQYKDCEFYSPDSFRPAVK